jgi:predicted DNA-binding protein YlxM (UPF0122 family)
MSLLCKAICLIVSVSSFIGITLNLSDNCRILTSEERHYIAIGIKQGMSKNKIAQHLNRSHSTIIREIKRNTDKRGYSHSKAMAVFYKIVKLAKNGVLMIIHIYAKVSTIKPATNLFRRPIKI